MTTREIYEKIKSVSQEELNLIDMSTEKHITSKMSVFALYYEYPSGKEHYRLLKYISRQYKNENIFDIGTNNGVSALALSHEKSNHVNSYDIVYFHETEFIKESNITFNVSNILDTSEVLNNTKFIMLDTNHDGTFEKLFYEHLTNSNYKGLLFCDDIHLNPEMEVFWNSIRHEKVDLTSIGHNTGSGLVIFE
jgi:predicted O-methyltransferase YrrM